MFILNMSPPLTSTPFQDLSSLRVLAPSNQIRILQLPFGTLSFPSTSTIIRMGGGPRTFPGGVSKWQWKRMQAKKAKQLLKARLCRERQIYEMRKRAELRAAVTELERPWEVVERAPTLFSVSADEQLKTLADRFQRPGGYDLWSEKDGPQLFQTADGLPSARFFPKGVVHSVKPYGRIEGLDNLEGDKELSLPEGVSQESNVKGRKGSRRLRNSVSRGELDSEGVSGYQVLESTSSSMKNLRISSGSEERKMDMELSTNVDNKQMSGSSYGGRNGKVSYRGSSRNSGNGRNVGLRDKHGLQSEQSRFDTEGRGENSLPRRSRDGNRSYQGSSGNKGNWVNGGLRDSHGLEPERHRFKAEGRGESPLVRKGRDGDDSYRGSSRNKGNWGRGSNGLEPEQLRFNTEGQGENPLARRGRDGNGSYRGSSRNKGNWGRDSHGLEPERHKFNAGGRGDDPSARRGRAGSNTHHFYSRRDCQRPKMPHTREVYDMSLKQDGSYEFQANPPKHLLKSGSEGSFELGSY